MHLSGHGRARASAPVSGWPPRPRTTKRASSQLDPELCRRQAGRRHLRVRGRRAALALQAAHRLCGHHRLQSHGLAMLQRRRQSRRHHQHGGAHRDRPLPAPRGALQGSHRGGAQPRRTSILTTTSSAWKKPTCARMPARAWARWTAYREILADNAKPGYFASARWSWPTSAWATPCAASATTTKPPQAYEQAAWTQNVGPELKIRSLLAAGECRDLNGERQLAIKDYQAAIDAGPNTSRADTPENTCATPTGETERSSAAAACKPRSNGTAAAYFRMLKCPSLSEEVSIMAVFCHQCGTGLPPSARFCSSCGAVIPADAAHARQAAGSAARGPPDCRSLPGPGPGLWLGCRRRPHPHGARILLFRRLRRHRLPGRLDRHSRGAIPAPILPGVYPPGI